MNRFFFFKYTLTFFSFLNVLAQSDGSFTISTKQVSKIDSRIFGQFLEKHTDELGPEFALNSDSSYMVPEVVAQIKALKIPVVRFPGGTMIDYMDWRAYIKNTEQRAEKQNVTIWWGKASMPVNFGFDEFFRLKNEAGFEAIVVLNLNDGVELKKPLEVVAQENAGALAAYLAAPLQNNLPENLKIYPELRKKNGHPEPYKVEYFQLGNENWFHRDRLLKSGLSKEQVKERFVQATKAYIDAIKPICPNAVFVLEGQLEGGEDMAIPGINKAMAEAASGSKILFTHHYYLPWGMKTFVRQNGDTLKPQELTREQIYYGWMSAWVNSATGQSFLEEDEVYTLAKANNWKIAITEWNFNTWWNAKKEVKDTIFDSMLGRGLGAANFLNAMLRKSDMVTMGCQSMLVGNKWEIAGISVNTKKGQKPITQPSALVTGLYSNHHGENLVEVLPQNLSSYSQPFQITWLKPCPKVAYVDVVATAGNKKLYLHIINRKYNDKASIKINLDGYNITGKGKCFELNGDLIANPKLSKNMPIARISESVVKVKNEFTLSLNPHSVSVYEIELK